VLPTRPTTPHDAEVIFTETLHLIQTRAVDVLNAIDDGVFCLDSQGRTIFVNEAASRLLGFTNREMLGRSMHDLTHHHYADGTEFPADSCPILSSVTDAVQQRVGGDTFWTKSGQPLAVDYTSIPIKEGRNVAGVVVTFRDIGDQQRVAEQALRLKGEREARAEAERAREALRESEERYRFMAEAIPVLVWTSLPDGKLDYVTERVGQYFGIPTEQLLRDGWRDVVHPDDLPGVGAHWMHSLSTGEPYNVEFRLRAADGTFRWHLARALPQKDAKGAIVKWFGTNTDIEDQKRNQRPES
jgi:PAS domain S-box-containing protein